MMKTVPLFSKSALTFGRAGSTLHCMSRELLRTRTHAIEATVRLLNDVERIGRTMREDENGAEEYLRAVVRQHLARLREATSAHYVAALMDE